MPSAEVRDFDIIVLHYNGENKLPSLRQAFQIIHRRKWVNHPYKILYEPSLTMFMMDDRIGEIDDDTIYNGVYIALAGKGSFEVHNQDAIKPDDLARCVIEIGRQMERFVMENKEKYGWSNFQVRLEDSYVLDEVRKFLSGDSTP